MTRPKGEGVRIEKVTMTKDLAEQLLSINVHNRNERFTGIRAYATDMSIVGGWVETGDTIKVSKTNKLIDGQHRLVAFLRAAEDTPDLKVPMWIAWNVDEKAQDYTDSGIKRLLSDQLKLKGKGQPVALAAILRITNAWIMKERRGLGSQGLATNATLLRLLDKHPELEEVAHQAVADATKCSLPASVLGLSRWLFSGIDENDAESFFEKLTSDTELVKGDPIYELRKAATRVRDENGRRGQALRVALTIKAWNMWRNGQVLGDTGLSFKMGGANPERFPEPV